MTNRSKTCCVIISFIIAVIMGILLNASLEYMPIGVKIIIQILSFIAHFLLLLVLFGSMYRIIKKIEFKYNFYCLMETIFGLLMVFFLEKLVFSNSVHFGTIIVLFGISTIFAVLASFESQKDIQN